MVDITSALILGFHGAIAMVFVAIGVAGYLSGSAMPAVAVRLLTALLVAVLGVVVTRIVRRR